MRIRYLLWLILLCVPATAQIRFDQLAPPSGCTNGQVPTWNAPSFVWTCTTPTGTGGSPGGSDTQGQFNDAGAFGGIPSVTYIKATPVLKIQAGAKFLFTDPTDATKAIQLDLSGITTGTTRTGTLPNANFTFVVPFTCTNQAATAASASGTFTCTTITSSYTSGTFPATAHALLSATHSDTAAAAPIRGDGIFAIGATPTWQRVAHPSVTGGYFKWNGTDIVASTLAASGTGACGASNWASTLNADAAPTCTQPSYNDIATGAIVNGTTATTQASSDNSTKPATTAYVTTGIANAIAAVNPAVAVQAATAAVLPNTPTYANGVGGIGATLTAGVTNTALVVDGYTPVLNDRILVKNQASAFQNGVYTVTQVASVGLAWILTRALDYDQPSDMNNTGAIPVVNGTVNTDTQWVQTSKVNTVGTDAVTFTQFSLNPTTLITTSTTAGGDLSGTYPNPVVAKVNGTTVPTNAAADQAIITTASAVGAWKPLPLCNDTGGNHLNYDTATHAFSCGTSGGGSGGSPGGSTTQLQFNDAGAFNGAVGATYDQVAQELTLLPLWNNISTTFTGLTENVTDTASSPSSLLMDLQDNSVSKFNVDKFGNTTIPGATQPQQPGWVDIYGLSGFLGAPPSGYCRWMYDNTLNLTRFMTTSASGLATPCGFDTVTAANFNGAIYVDGVKYTTPQQAIAALPSTGGTVYLGCGTYTFPTNITSNIALLSSCPGEHRQTIGNFGASPLVALSQTVLQFTTTQTLAGIQNVRMEDLTLDCQGTGSGVVLSAATGNQFNYVTLNQCGDTAVPALKIQSSGSTAATNSSGNVFDHLRITCDQTPAHYCSAGVLLIGAGTVNAGGFATLNTFIDTTITGSILGCIDSELNSDTNYFVHVTCNWDSAAPANSYVLGFNLNTPGSDQDADGGQFIGVVPAGNAPTSFIRAGQSNGNLITSANGNSGPNSSTIIGGTPTWSIQTIGLPGVTTTFAEGGGTIAATGAGLTPGPAAGSSAGDITAARTATTGQMMLGNDGSGLFRNGNFAYPNTSTGTWFGMGVAEQASSSTSGGFDIWFGNSTTHTLQLCNNGGGCGTVSYTPCVTTAKVETAADTNVLTCTPPALAGNYEIQITLDVSAASAATLGWTATWTNSKGTAVAPTNMSLFQMGVAAPALTFTAAASNSYYAVVPIAINNAGTAIVVKTTFSGTSIAYNASARVVRIQ